MRDVELNCLERIALEKLFLVLELERETALPTPCRRHRRLTKEMSWLA
jgi:hypothetical protein